MQVFQPLSLEYDEEKEWLRQKDGVQLPFTTSQAIRRLYPKDAWSAWGGIRLSHDRTYYVTPGSNYVLQSTIRRVLGSNETPHRLLASYLTIPNGQVKNFLNACRACVSIGPGLERIAIVGSKASEGGGLWHKYFALWVSTKCSHVIIDFYDPNEKSDSWTLRLGSSMISCEWIPGIVSVDTLVALDYTVVIDDSWTYESGSGLSGRERIKAKGYSFKGRAEEWSSDVDYWNEEIQIKQPLVTTAIATSLTTKEYRMVFVPFLHSTETRSFSHPPLRLVGSGCGCMTCRVCKQCSRSYDEYLYLRYFCSRLGHQSPCVGVSFQSDLSHVSDLRSRILTHGQVEMSSVSALRTLMSLTEEMSLTVRGMFVQLGAVDPKFESYRRYSHNQEGMFELETYPWLNDKLVLFCGVPATVVGSTKIHPWRLGSQSPSEVDVVFFNSLQSWKLQFSGKVVYVPVDPRAVLQQFPDWEFTGRKINNFYEYSRGERRIEVKEVSTPYQKWRGGVHVPLQIFPYLDSSYLKEPLRQRGRWEKGGEFYSLSVQGTELVVGEYRSDLWRQSIWVKGSIYCPIKVCIEHLQDASFVKAAISLPWNMEPDEIVEIEARLGHTLHPRLRQWSKESKVLTERDIREISKEYFGGQCYDESGCKFSRKQNIESSRSLFFEFIKRKGEFKLQSGILLRTREAHPAFSQGVLHELWLNLKGNYGNLQKMMAGMSI